MLQMMIVGYGGMDMMTSIRLSQETELGIRFENNDKQSRGARWSGFLK